MPPSHLHGQQEPLLPESSDQDQLLEQGDLAHEGMVDRGGDRIGAVDPLQPGDPVVGERGADPLERAVLVAWVGSGGWGVGVRGDGS